MAKQFDIYMDKNLFEKSSGQIRKKEELIILLLETIKRYLNIGFIPENKDNGKVIIHVSKMSRIIFVMENKYFSFNFPFCINENSDKLLRVYDSELDVDINSKMISIILGFINENGLRDKSVEDIYYRLSDEDEGPLSSYNIYTFWSLIRKLMLFETGYLRYDYDEKHKKEKIHPLNHLDINFNSNNAFKIGLNNKVVINEFIDILDIETDCYFLQKN